MSATLDIKIQQGSDWTRVVTITDSVGDPINLFNASFAGQIRTTHKSADVQADFAFSLYTNGTDGKVVVTLTDTQTAAIQSGKLAYDIEWTDAAGTVRRLLEGVAVVSPEVTRV